MTANTSSFVKPQEEWAAYAELRGKACLAAIACVQGLSISDAEAVLDHAKDQVRRNTLVQNIPRENISLTLP